MCLLETNPTQTTPEIYFDIKKGILRISGVSTPTNAVLFYQKLLDWLNLYTMHPAKHTSVIIEVSQLNSMSYKPFLQLFEKLVKLHKNGETALTIKWFYHESDEEMEESIQIFSDILRFQIAKRKEVLTTEKTYIKAKAG